MRTVLIVSCLLVATAAHAEPAPTEPASASRATYFAAGVSLGSVTGHTAVGAQLDTGVHVKDSLWLHAGASTAAEGMLFDGKGTASSVHGGVELSRCRHRDRVCGYFGGDLGYAQSRFTPSSWFGESVMTSGSDGMIGVVRFGLDVGGDSVSWRPGIEATLGAVSSAALTQSISVAF